jgi:cobalamin biosynthetic protein CobC
MDVRKTMPEGADELRHHGGNINLAQQRFPDAPLPWLDLSTGINPAPYPVGEIPPAAWARLPEPAAVAALAAAAGAAYGAGPGAEVVAAPGTQALIQWLSRIFPARRVGILGFTYGEHANCWRVTGAEVSTVREPEDLAAFDVGVVVNPNNPDGRCFPQGRLTEVARSLVRRGGMLIVDEAFMDAAGPRESLVPALPETGIVVLRSFGKIYGLAGIRLGFAVTSPALAAPLRQAIGPWAVSGPAIEIGRRALSDGAWLGRTVARLGCETARLDRLLRSAGFEIVGGTPLFRLAAQPDANAWFNRLCRAGILTRAFPAKPDWLRFGIPHKPADWERLDAALNCRVPSPCGPSN